MKISMWMLYDALSDECARHNLDDASKKICLKGCLPYQGPENITEAYLYVADAAGEQQLTLPPKPCFLVVSGENIAPDDSGACQYIVMKRPHLFSTALQHVLWAFEKYADWQDALQAELNGAQNLNSLCRLGSALLGNDTMLYDREYTIIAGEFAIDRELSERYEEKNGPYYTLTSDAIRQLKSNSDFQQTFRRSGAAMIKVDFLSHSVLYVNLGQGNVYEGRLCITDALRPFKNGDYQIAEILTGFLRIAIKRQAFQTSDESRRFVAFLLGMLDGAVPSAEQLEAALRLWHWKRFGRYLCIRVSLNELDAETSSDLYLLSKIALSLPGSCSVRYNTGLITIVNLSAKETADDIVDKLGRFLIGFIPNIGISGIYQDFMETAQFAKQAVIAAEMGARDDRKNWHHYFGDYAMAHYFRYGTSVLPAIHFCDADVRRLMAYQDARTDYYNTLKVYLENNMNLLETSKALFIHRTTLFNRLGRIRELISADLNNPDDRTRMLISFKLMEADKLYGQG